MPVRMVRIQSSPDGSERRLDFREVPSDDPAVRSRLECRVSADEREITTTFRSTTQRPRTYPEGLPFIAGAQAHTNEFPGSDRRPRARWSTFVRSRRIFDEVVRQSIAAGWIPDAAIDLPSPRGVVRKAYLRHAGHVRWVFEVRFSFYRIVNLEEFRADGIVISTKP